MPGFHRERLTGRGEPGEGCGAPTCETLPDGQFADHWILSDEERAKGFVRQVGDRYRHVGRQPRYPTRPLTAAERERFRDEGYVAFEPYPVSALPVTGRYWTAQQLAGGCGGETRMPLKIAETYAREPGFYGSTFCAGCGKYLPVGADGEFEWLDGTKVGT